MTPGLNLIVLRSTDLERARSFYECLGLQFIQHRHGSGPEHLSAELGGCVFELYPQSSNGASTCATRIGFRVPSLDTVIEALGAFPPPSSLRPRTPLGAVVRLWWIRTGIEWN